MTASPTAAKISRPVRRLRRLVEDPATIADALVHHVSSPAGNFDRLTAASDSSHIGAIDLVALTALGAPASIESASWILSEVGQWLTAEILADVPTDVALPDAGVATVHRIADLFGLLRREGGLTRSASTRLLAAKRPHLVPIDDGTTRRALRYPKSDAWWVAWREALDEPNRALVRTGIARAAERVGETPDLAQLRVVDIALRSQVLGS